MYKEKQGQEHVNKTTDTEKAPMRSRRRVTLAFKLNIYRACLSVVPAGLYCGPDPGKCIRDPPCGDQTAAYSAERK